MKNFYQWRKSNGFSEEVHVKLDLSHLWLQIVHLESVCCAPKPQQVTLMVCAKTLFAKKSQSIGNEHLHLRNYLPIP